MGSKDLAAFFAEVSQDLMRQGGETSTLEHVAQRAVEIVPACDHCGISVRASRHRVVSAASSSELARRCDELQYDLAEGPCLDAVWQSDSYLANDVLSDPRWPQWGRAVAEAGLGSVLSIRLGDGVETFGALNLYAQRPHVFTDEDVDLAVVYAAHAGNAIQAARHIGGLDAALTSRHLIGVAQGIIMSRYGMGMEHAFEVLRRYSSNANIKIRELADLVIDGKELPDLAALRRADPSGPPVQQS